MKKILFCLLLSFSLFNVVYAVDLELTQGLNKALPIAMVPFNHQSLRGGEVISDTIKKDLMTTGLFRLTPYDTDKHNPKNALDADFSYWKVLGVNHLIVGNIIKLQDDMWSVSFQLLDPVTRAHIMLSQVYNIPSSEARALAHHISDLIYQQLTGNQGIFSTRIAYILVQRQEEDNARYTLEVADYDGQEPTALLESSEPLMSPSWSPDAKHIAYVSFENKRAEIYIIDILTGKRKCVSSYPGINGAPKWSPDGKKLAMVLSKSGDPKIYMYDLENKSLTQLTRGFSIDTEPYFSSDGKSLLFTSSRGGSPQIYQINLTSKKVKRLTFDGKYNSSASYSPRQDKIIMLHRDKDRFHIALQDLVSGDVMPLTFSKYDNSPSLSPNGKMVLYSTQLKGKGILRIVSIDGKVRLELPHKKGDIQNPAWSPFIKTS